MTRITRAALSAALLTAGLGAIGCTGTGHSDRTLGDRYRNYVDPCYPERYNHAARQAVLAPFAQQVANGHALDQTLFTFHFEYGTDTLTQAGRDKLDSIARGRPADPKLFVQAATTDIPLTDANADVVATQRAELDAKRAAAVQKYLSTVPAVAPVPYEIYVHNVPTPGIYSEFATSAYRASGQGYSGMVTGMGGAGGLGGGGGQGAIGTGGGTNLTSPAGTGSGQGGFSGGLGAPPAQGGTAPPR